MARAIGHFVRCSFVLFFQSTNWRRFVGVSSLTFALGLNRFCKMIHYSSLMWFSFNQNWFRLTLSSELATNNNMSHQMRYGRFVFFLLDFTQFYRVSRYWHQFQASSGLGQFRKRLWCCCVMSWYGNGGLEQRISLHLPSFTGFYIRQQ